ncbi:MAG TPA: PAS domain S-box protein [Rubrobacter sp.]|nr:PAS domain S-box protein [Rubrobacter sp.]
MGAPLRVLLVEDSENDALLLLRQLRRGGYEPLSMRVDTAGEMEAALEGQTWDLVISDHSMPAFSSLGALDLLRGKGFVDLPFIIVSGRIGEDAAVSAMKAGAHDYIMKDNLARLNSAIERELREAEVRRRRREAEAALRDSETRFRLMIEQSPLSIQIFSPDGRTLRVNRAWEELWGVTLDRIPGYNVLQDPQLREKGLMPYIEMGFAGEATVIPPVQYEPDASIPDASEVAYRWVRAFIYPVKAADESIQEVVLIHEDITERLQAEEDRWRAEENYRSIFENAVEGIFQTTADGRFLAANPALARMYGYASPEDLIERVTSIGEQIYADAGRRDEFGRLIQREGFVQDFEMRVRRGDGKTAWTSVNARAVRDEEGRIVGYEGFVKDITEQKQAEEALGEIREAERRRIARELHDVVLQDLTYALQSLRISPRMPEGADRDAEAGRQVEALQRSVSGIRDAIYDLRLEGAGEQTLARSLESIVELSRQLSPGCAFGLTVGEGFPRDGRGPLAVEVARVVQEALANVRRHSGAEHASVRLLVRGDEALVEILDDGRGFAPGTAAGMGLTGMRERAASLDGELEVEGSAGSGTRVSLRVPLASLLDAEDAERANA